MRQINGRQGLQGLAFGFVLAVGGVAGAVEPDEEGALYLNSEFMIMGSSGTDLDVFELKLEDNSGNSSLGTIGLDSGVDFGWRGDLQWKEGPWGVGISGFYFDDEADEDVSIPGDTGSQETSLRFAGEGVDCDDDEFCIGSASSEWETWMVDLYAIRELVSSPNASLDLQMGMRIASFEWEASAFAARVEEVAGEFITQTDGSFVNSTSDLDDPLVGPFLALLGKGRFGRFHLEGQLTQAVVFGEWDGSAVFSQFQSGQPLSDLFIDEQAALGSSKDLTIPITDVRLRVGFEVIDNLILGFGGYATTWFNVPRPPNSVAADRPESVSTFQTDEENITMLGASFSLSYRFATGGLLPF